MKSWLIALILIVSCSSLKAQSNRLLAANDFYAEYTSAKTAMLIDIRTPAEYSKGFILNAVNMDYYDDDFRQKIQSIDTAQVLFVYCQSGGRSAEAVEWMRSSGYTHVYELKGGYKGWKQAKLPVNESFTPTDKISKEAFDQAVSSGKVLVDFYAPWCGPCKKMEPYLKEIESKYGDAVKVLRINVDENVYLSNQLKVKAIPLLHIYQDGKKVWVYNSYISRNKLFKVLGIQER